MNRVDLARMIEDICLETEASISVREGTEISEFMDETKRPLIIRSVRVDPFRDYLEKLSIADWKRKPYIVCEAEDEAYLLEYGFSRDDLIIHRDRINQDFIQDMKARLDWDKISCICFLKHDIYSSSLQNIFEGCACLAENQLPVYFYALRENATCRLTHPERFPIMNQLLRSLLDFWSYHEQYGWDE